MLKLKKTALSLFGLAVMLICVNPPKANAGVVVSIGGPVYPRPVYVRPYRYVAPVPYIAYRPDPYFYGPTYRSTRLGLSPGLLREPALRSTVRASRVRGASPLLATVRNLN